MNIKLKINYKFWVSCIAVLAFFKPIAVNSLEQYALLDKIWDIIKIITGVIILYYVCVRKFVVSKSVMYLIGLESIFLISTLMHKVEVNAFLVQSFSIILFSILTYNLMKKDCLQYCKALFYSLSLLIVIHAIFMILYPNGMGYDKVYYNAIYFLAGKNGLVKFLFPSIIAGLLMNEIDKKKCFKRVLFVILLSIYICIKSDTITSAVGICICLLCYVILRIKISDLKLDFQKIFLAVFIFCIIFTILQINGVFIKILNIFFTESKLQNYTDRIYIWKEAVIKIRKSPFIGYGMARDGGHIIINNKPMYAHNGYLEILLYGGIIGFFVFILILRRFLFSKARYFSNETMIIASGIIGFLIMMLTETHINTIAFWAFIVMYDYQINKKFIEGKKSENL